MKPEMPGTSLKEPVTVLHTPFRGRGHLSKDASLQDGGPFKPAIKGVQRTKSWLNCQNALSQTFKTTTHNVSKRHSPSFVDPSLSQGKRV